MSAATQDNPQVLALMTSYPRKRPSMSEAVARLYEQQYLSNRKGNSLGATLSSWAESWMHRQVASDLIGMHPFIRVLEIGAGNLNHLSYEPSVEHYEVVEPFEALFQSSVHQNRLAARYRDLSELPMQSRFDRIISIAAFEHLTDLPWSVARCALALNVKGSLRVAVPSEGGWLWWLGWRLTTGFEFALKYGLDYGEIMRHEHLSSVIEIEAILRYFFKSVAVKRLGFGVHASLYTFFCCAYPDTERSLRYIENRA